MLAATLELPRTLNVAVADPGTVADLTAADAGEYWQRPQTVN
jgi:hypothetical protein